MFSIDVREEERGTVLVLRGELDHDSVVQLDEAGRRATAPGGGEGTVVADLAGLTFCDSSGVSALLRLYRALKARHRVLALAAVPPTVLRLFALTGLDQIFTVHADVHGALAAGRDTAPGAGAPARQNGKETT
ncbi:anti-sigma factor antagonist [Streptomyces sp. NE5-10]|uniref:STAS domain-containing protein n=1 Tax=Streptomyces sp. NE5-10 TaxID=2759674 RepID=UPI001906A3AA|nr:STAS domain-containing protein [Streptomyces sp. NE5-10]GHJ93483.1 anti-sigma factor antagonist [Streptomyces sp. NE5-10]